MAQFPEMLNARHLVTGCAIILGDLSLNNDLRVEFAGNDKIRRLIESFNPIRTPGG